MLFSHVMKPVFISKAALSFCFAFSRQTSKNMSNSKLFVRLGNEESMRLSFVYGNQVIPETVFNFSRLKNEKLKDALIRMQNKIEAAALKVTRKKKKKEKLTDSNSAENKTMGVEITVLKDGNILDLNIPNEQAWTEGTQLRINQNVYNIVLNPPSVDLLSLPKTVMADFPIYPKVSLEFCDKLESVFTWYRSLSKAEIEQHDEHNVCTDKNNKHWLQVWSGWLYISSKSDVGRYLKVTCLPKRGNNSGLIEESVSKSPVSDGPAKCLFEERHSNTKSLTTTGSIRCISYNILADLYADSDTARNELFSYCPPEFLQLEYRKPLFLKEILGYNGDIICLQEVDTKVFLHDLNPVLSLYNLKGIFTEKACQTGEGVACFFRENKFRLVHQESIMLYEALQNEEEYSDLWNKVQENDKFKDRMLSRSTALQVVVLESLDVPGNRIVVGNTHLFFHPDSANVRLIQATMCIRRLECLVKKYQSESPDTKTSYILCGDFNSCPQFGVFKLATEGSVPANYADWSSNKEEEVPGMDLQHSLSFGSACGTPPYTNYTEGFHGCLDYIFYDENSLSVSEVVPFPEHDLVTEYTALPCKVYPSDHLALICTLKWK